MTKNNDYSFDFKTFVEELHQNDKKKEMLEKYEHLFGCLDAAKFEDQPFFKQYLSSFEIPAELPNNLAVNEKLAQDFDFGLLLCLVASSFSSEYSLTYDEQDGKIHLNISVTCGEQSITKDLYSLWSFQIQKLYEIYIIEQMDLAVLATEDEQTEKDIKKERDIHLRLFTEKVEAVNHLMDLHTAYQELKSEYEKLVS
ncbi:MAG: hypothetical protein K6F40_01985 [Bacteroidales bacterium]|nr:hypothetical protein [Bacteroidales bacterium]